MNTATRFFLACLLSLSAWGADDPLPVVYCDLTPLLAQDLTDDADRWQFWDETHLAVALQGLANRSAPRLFLRYVMAPDDFWWQQMTQSGGWLSGRPVIKIASIEELLERFAGVYQGAVVWDERVPATSNLASTLAGCEDLLPLRFDQRPGSLYQRLAQTGRLKVKTRLLRDDGSPLFTGRGTIPGTARASSGSAKNDAYRWLIEHYVKPGKVNPRIMGYYLDAFWHQRWRESDRTNHTLTNQDFVIARRGVLFDLNVWDDEACVDDPQQAPGTDVATLKELLHAAYGRFQGNGLIHVAGFVPWAYKYTDFHAAGGHHPGVPTEWRYAEILSCFNAYMDADALGLNAMANASLYQHYPLAEHYPQNPKPTRASLAARGLLDAQGKILPRRFVAHYVGDYDAAAWLYRELPRLWNDPARGTTPLSWAFNPGLAYRFPLGLAWARERRSPTDWFVAGDSGAGYLNPGFLTEPRPHSGLPSGLAAWESECQRLFRQWDISLTGFVIDGYARGLDRAGLDAYARFSPDGIVGQKVERQGVHGTLPFLRMATDLHGTPAEAARAVAQINPGAGPRFTVCRSILQPPAWYAQIEKELTTLDPRIQVVDLYTLLWLVREFESHRSAYADPRIALAKEVSATPDKSDGLAAAWAGDGPVTEATHQGTRCWRLASSQGVRYLYFDVDDSFFRPGSGPLDVALEYFDQGSGTFALHYDATGAAYQGHPHLVHRRNSGTWQTATFPLRDARFAGSQNSAADFRIYGTGEDLLIRRVRVLRR